MHPASVYEKSILTFAVELVARALDLEVDPSPPLRVVAAAEVGHGLLALLVHVHITHWKRVNKS